jgi:hypothetical protein
MRASRSLCAWCPASHLRNQLTAHGAHNPAAARFGHTGPQKSAYNQRYNQPPIAPPSRHAILSTRRPTRRKETIMGLKYANELVRYDKFRITKGQRETEHVVDRINKRDERVRVYTADGGYFSFKEREVIVTIEED